MQYLDYRLSNGYISNWLMAGPHCVPAAKGALGEEPECPPRLLEALGDPEDGPAEYAALDLDQETLRWQYFRCAEDHWLDASGACPPGYRLQAYAYTELYAPAPQEVILTLQSKAAVILYAKGKVVLSKPVTLGENASVSAALALEKGNNRLLVCLAMPGQGLTPCTMALRVDPAAEGALDGLAVWLPTRAKRPGRRLTFEDVFEYAYLPTPVVYKGNAIHLNWSDALEMRWRVQYSIQDEQGRIYLHGMTESERGAGINVGHPGRLWERQYYATLRAHPMEFFEENLRYQRRIPVYVLDTPYSYQPYATEEERRRWAFEYAAKREDNVFGEIAKMALGRWGDLNADLFKESLEGISQRRAGFEARLVGLLGMLERFGSHEDFPAWLHEAIAHEAMAFDYDDESGTPGTDGSRLLLQAAKILAGQRWGEQRFVKDQTGEALRTQGEAAVLALLRRWGKWGFCEWDSNATFADYTLALTHLADLAASEPLREMAAILMDKMFFTMAVNSYKGVFGSTHGYTRTPMILSGQLEATSGIERILWGMGVWNPFIEGTVALACSAYQLPPIIGLIALEAPDEIWHRERHRWDEGAQEVNKVTYKTPDYMLASAQDYRPGERGSVEHIWQATLGEDAIVFVNHPACMLEHEAHRPNFWRGNGVLPRVAQWKDVLVALYRLPERDPLGFTHAYFPVEAFDEYALRDGWIFARKGKGYVALTASHGLEMVKRGPGAYRELRSYGRETVWLCHMGRQEQDGSFEAFRRRVLAMPLAWQGLAVQFESLRGQRIAFSWSGAFTVDGAEVPLRGYPHYEGPYAHVDFPANEMRIQWRDAALVLDFS